MRLIDFFEEKSSLMYVFEISPQMQPFIPRVDRNGKSINDGISSFEGYLNSEMAKDLKIWGLRHFIISLFETVHGLHKKGIILGGHIEPILWVGSIAEN